MKKVIIAILATLLVLFILAQLGMLQIFGINRIEIIKPNTTEPPRTEGYDYMTDKATGVRYRVKAEGDYFYLYSNGKWERRLLTGINIGAGEPGIFPGELTISYDTYIRWFKYISDMNCNCIRVYTAMRPQFYSALNDFNKNSENPLYLFQGVWINEDDIARLADVYAENRKILNEFKADALQLIDIVHGNANVQDSPGQASGAYTADISKWFAGWIIGLEWEPAFVRNTNDINRTLNFYDGQYLYTQAATPFEAFLCEVGDAMIAYETEKYRFQSPLAFTNWITTDPITHPDEPHYDEDSVTVNVENIKSRNAYLPNMFASYHIYPYYPDCLNYQRDYLDYIDESGKVNTYRAYLKDLKLAHTLPILVSEFGLPTSRGMGHESVMGYNQGGVDETEQGRMLLDMFNSIFEENYAGGLAFNWQDEWFKRTWNNSGFDIADRRPFWSNIQTTEQCFGILTFDPGEKQCTVYIDGDFSDWKDEKPVAVSDVGSLYMKSDERYVYFYADAPGFDINNDTLLIPIDTISGQGNGFMAGGAKFDAEADFVISINGKNNTRILTDAYYDDFYYLYGVQYKMLQNDSLPQKNSGVFNKMMMCYGYELTVPTTGEKVGFKSFETGLLKYGNSNPSAKDYSSLADFCSTEGKIELRIPWQLLNVTDPSEKKQMDDFYTTQSFASKAFEYFSVGLGNNSGEISLNGTYQYEGWSWPTYHERLKPAYYELQEGLKKYHE